ncbi:MAG: phosphoribosyl-ATP pyrophosphatase, partial [Actinobacteria bacterium]|nr:phosphoribosyl-ATP pyrophosphatase [Actinomycetota bacterium]NIT96239.1 phosphoribosyl-ATP pyrophosphatase [Actinomycetota bacterium]NIU19930.1 phosphoribosyl-ATP pyrophosphatase [Actinomycetota bacterium]NIV56398.1 phosphoribosyl-ATP pyrophosphatase [Actinomycetota bacterium]NIV87901.1 phosphoribosyl-ATP pyrophosphatase [Actinomycetota bacterium]
MAEPSGDLLCRLARVIAERRGSQPEVSYVAGLLARGEDALLKKVGEEA